MAEWILSMAEEDPTAIMSSIVFKPDYYYQYDEDGNKVRVWYYDEEGNYVRANRKMKIYVALKELLFCDIVDQGAATDKLFSEQFNSDKFAVVATQFLNDHPEIDRFVREQPDTVAAFIAGRHEPGPDNPLHQSNPEQDMDL